MVTKKPKGLGRGLEALLGPSVTTSAQDTSPSGGTGELALSDLVPGMYQPRTRMDEGALYELAESIRAQGIMQPILVRRLSEGAHAGKGLGLRFLRHIERNSLLLFMIPADTDNIQNEYNILLNELKQYNPELLHKERLLAITKSDMLDDELKAEISKDLPAIPYLFISSVAQQGLTELKDLIWKHLNHDWISISS